MKVISFCIYGSKDKYCKGLEENLQIIQQNLNDYHVFIYVGDCVPLEWIECYKSFSFVTLFYTNSIGHCNMIHRFYAIDEPHVDIVHVRDADSRIHSRDIWCIQTFEQSSAFFYTIRDHPNHYEFILGGLWGIKKNCIQQKIQNLYLLYNPLKQTINQYYHDQFFLRHMIYPLVALNGIFFVFHKKMQMHEIELIVEIPFKNTNID
jgi:hypothetical protein